MKTGTITVDGHPVGTISFSLSFAPSDDPPPDLDGYAMRREADSMGIRGGGGHHYPGHEAAHHDAHRGHGGGAHLSDRVHNRTHHGTAAHLSDRAHHHTGHLPEDEEHVHGEFAEGRRRAREELAQKPWLRDKLKRIMANEQGSNPEGTQGIAESAINRMVNRGTSLEKELRWHRSEGGYYDEGSMGRGAVENPHHNAVLERSLDRALAGSNITGNATDNSSGALAAREKATGKFRHHRDINGESFFSPGYAEPALRDKWQRQNWAADSMKAAEAHKAKQEAEKPAQQLARGEIAP
ncbi:hypothetical protein ACE102_03100 [Bradyrhizobium sp. vgs-9]|uniref:hypothetical protein n=1 Tax=Bradyrhizobium sp. vgs-9 TaxID=208389 RepID=UPI0035D3FD1F